MNILNIDFGLYRITGNKDELWLLLPSSGNLQHNIQFSYDNYFKFTKRY
jgi:hypothetical protein